ncbi:haloacid dehalogenase-like hydrolase family protein [Tritrichomonas foetus]|uniref:Haloacid dehalogenase-like hydrolase family protein n=1 Tax=Tritrichomonas foetus TaxID=1144522 RepID=A0A1J4KEI0_9EUKA|nr:haloacid dehalogenase-like hydrolase family protein [Tritrichomonas foetus]|eukprot:OHT09344.1 haloacid dehalogenase-like hydrolase family protein [Tritrichomonas foetus]
MAETKEKVWPHPIEAIIFDNDGLLLDTEGIYVLVLEQMMGRKLEWDLRRKLIGRTGPDACSILVKEMGIDEDPIHFLNRRDENLKKIFPTAKFFDYAVEIVKEAKINRKIPIAVATSSNRANYEVKISNKHDFYDLFDSVICGDEVENGKPNPELFLKSMEKLGVKNPQNVLVFEDAPTGVKGANNAGMPVVQVPDPELPADANQEAGAQPTLVLKSLREFDFDKFDWAPRA